MFHLRFLPPGTREILVAHPCHPSRAVLVEVSEGRAVSREVVLPEGCAIRGRVAFGPEPPRFKECDLTAFQGLPGTEMRCMWIFSAGERARIELLTYDVRIQTESRDGNRLESDGRFDLRGLEPGACRISWWVRLEGDSLTRQSVVLELRRGQDAAWDAAGPRPHRVVGTISQGGRPVAKEWFHLHGRSPSAAACLELRTDERGAFESWRVPPGTYVATVEGDRSGLERDASGGYQFKDDGAGAQVIVPEGADARLDIIVSTPR